MCRQLSSRADQLLELTVAFAFDSGHRVSEERLAEISHRIPKIVILTGDKDGIVNPERSRDLANMLPGSEYIVFPEVGQ